MVLVQRCSGFVSYFSRGPVRLGSPRGSPEVWSCQGSGSGGQGQSRVHYKAGEPISAQLYSRYLLNFNRFKGREIICIQEFSVHVSIHK